MDEKPLVLYVEDNAMNRILVKKLLEHRGFRVMLAEDGPSGLGAAHEHLPDLILMDLGIPGFDGYEATRLLKADPVTRSIPVVALTAFAMPGDREKALGAGCDGYITKPINLAEFPGQIAGFLRLTTSS